MSHVIRHLHNVLRFYQRLSWCQGFLGGASGKESTWQCRRHWRCMFDPWVGKIPWRRKWQPTPVVFPGKLHGQRSLEGYNPWGCKELGTTEWLNTHRTRGGSALNFLKSFHLVFHSGWTSTFPPTVHKGSLFSGSSPTSVFICLLDESHFNKCEALPHCGFYLHLPDD